jgi:hypothetical protein
VWSVAGASVVPATFALTVGASSVMTCSGT